MTRLLLIGDVHLSESRDLDDSAAALQWCSELADQRQVDGVLIAGDLYEGRSTVAERAVLAQALWNLTDRGNRPVVIARGNHDRLGDLDVFRYHPAVTVCERPVLYEASAALNCDLLVLPWPERAHLAATGRSGEGLDAAGSAALADLVRGMVATRLNPARHLVVLGHLQVCGAVTSSAQPLVGGAIEVGLDVLEDTGATYVALGHVHKPQELTTSRVSYIGSLTCHDHGEEGEVKRVGVLTLGDEVYPLVSGRPLVEWVPVPCRRWVTVEAEVVEGRVEERVRGDLGDGTPTLDLLIDPARQVGDGAVVRYRYRCQEDEQHLFDHVAIRSRFASAHRLKVVAEVERSQRVRSAEVAAARTVEDKLRAWGVATDTEVPDRVFARLGELQQEVAP